MPKISKSVLGVSDGVVLAGESDISKNHWNLLAEKEKSEIKLTAKLKIKKDNRPGKKVKPE